MITVEEMAAQERLEGADEAAQRAARGYLPALRVIAALEDYQQALNAAGNRQGWVESQKRLQEALAAWHAA